MKILCIETTCDETAAAIVTDELSVLGSVVASQEGLHREFKGVVPEIAARAHVERIFPVIDQALKKAEISLGDLDAVAVCNTPGLSGSLLVGVVAAKSLCLVNDLPLIAINHLHAHVFACQLDAEHSVFPCVGMIVSGGHTHLYSYQSALSAQYMGGTIDDAAGEAFDKVASMLGLPYPGGPAVSRVALNGDPTAHQFPRSFIHEDRLDFSFSGLKTAVRYAIGGPGSKDISHVKLEDGQISDLAASFQQAVVDCLVSKSVLAVKQSGMKNLCVGGGVAANQVLRAQLSERCTQEGIKLFIAPREYCTDNAVMGAIAIERFKAGLFEDLSLNIKPGLVRH
ncbi:MAG: tRNA (adenosine(37)-N6)-threonylcarbamoyltransferase complex transferase subunit TsaD [Mariniblastus sp.]|nr:tRNA (adenosine(37)-N6)-threonylcarbamoyltransferase complex transferase subunit TsaD [Mariniblastus sp.]